VLAKRSTVQPPAVFFLLADAVPFVASARTSAIAFPMTAGVGGSIVVQNNERIPSWETLALQSGTVSQAQINEWKSRSDPEAVRAAAADPANRAKARENAMYGAWIALVSTLLSMAACIGGSLLGRGVAFHLYPVRVREERIVVPASP